MVRNLALFLTVTSTVSLAHAGSNYSVSVLPSFGGFYSAAYGINGKGEVVGASQTDAGVFRAFKYSNGQTIPLGLSDDATSVAYGINDAGQVVGERYTANYDQKAFLQSGDTMIDIGNGARSAVSINGNGEIVGYSESAPGSYRAFRYSNGTMTQIGSFSEGTQLANAINAAGTVVGEVVGNGAQRAVDFSSGVLGDPTVSCSSARGSNDLGDIVGFSKVGGFCQAGFLDASGFSPITSFLDHESFAFDINNTGQVVGSYGYVGAPTRAFLFEDGKFRDLSGSLGLSSQGWLITEARSINDSGLIAATGLRDGSYHALLLSPTAEAVPEPTTFAALGLGAAALLRRRRSR